MARLQAGKAKTASSKASRASSSPQSATSATRSPVAGETTGNLRAKRRHAPPMRASVGASLTSIP